MNPSQAIKESLIALATITGKELNAIALNAYMEALSDLDQGTVLLVLKDWLRTSKGFPFPADIRSKVAPGLSDEDEARECAVIIKRTIGKRGGYWTSGVMRNGQPVFEGGADHKMVFFDWDSAAKAEMGTLAAEVVKAFGGWSAMCDFSERTEPGTFQAQIRELAKTIGKKALRGDLDALPSLPEPAAEQTTKLIQTTMKGMGDA